MLVLVKISSAMYRERASNFSYRFNVENRFFIVLLYVFCDMVNLYLYMLLLILL